MHSKSSAVEVQLNMVSISITNTSNGNFHFDSKFIFKCWYCKWVCVRSSRAYKCELSWGFYVFEKNWVFSNLKKKLTLTSIKIIRGHAIWYVEYSKYVENVRLHDIQQIDHSLNEEYPSLSIVRKALAKLIGERICFTLFLENWLHLSRKLMKKIPIKSHGLQAAACLSCSFWEQRRF